MAKHYRPFLLARAGEFAGLSRLTALQSSISPVFCIPERAWDYENSRYSKSHEDHISGVPDRLVSSWEGGEGFLDLSLIDSDDLVDGKHPALYIVEATDAGSVALTPLLNSASSPAYRLAIEAIHEEFNRGAAIQLLQADWTTINPTALTELMESVSLSPHEIDLFIDFEGADGPVAEVAIATELASLRGFGNFRSVTVGGASFPDLAGVPLGVTEYARNDWNVYTSVQHKLVEQASPTPDFFDHVVQNPDLIELGVDPRVLSISAALRYTVSEKWLVAKGGLFKGRGTTSKGGAALIAPLIALVRHPEFATPIRSLADDWIEAVIADGDRPGAPQKWREWATVRHFEVVAHQLANLP
ncbi:beta family protein [Clavibacter michiganensis]|uniref:beta family protein n=1 Tax=Clavibacter michiganensis TaxID=28447 RepID=UPI00142F702B|nr:hypothetical protein [Clavibacter michiganensis]QIT12082.1 hypothetical protein GRD74_11640 [Clavibacter michiganensis subsp. michiganensis]